MPALANTSRACCATLCSDSTSNLLGTIRLTEVKSRWPRVAAYPMAAQTAPKTAPKSIVETTWANTLVGSVRCV